MEKNIEDVKEKVESMGVEPEDMEQVLEGAGERAVSTEGKAEDTEETEMSTEGKAAAEKAPTQNEGKKRCDKKKTGRAKIAGCMELAVAFILAVLSGGLFINTRGTRLLYVSVAAGRVSRYYYIFLLAALIFLIMGVFTLKLAFTYRQHSKKIS